MKDTLGGKGAGLAEMTNAGLPVPPGFTSARMCGHKYYENKGKLGNDVEKQLKMRSVCWKNGRGRSSVPETIPCSCPSAPVRSFPMPGMMDTVSQSWTQ